ncbi:MAG: SpoIIE family protein phosphatase [Alkalispirochaeta sp.]
MQSLTTRFLLIVVTFFVVFAGVSATWLFLEVGRITEEIGTRYARARVASSQAHIARILDREATLARNLARSPAVVRWIEREHDAELRTRAVREIENYGRAFADRNVFVGIRDSLRYYSWSSDGTLSESDMVAGRPEDDWFFETVAAGDTVSFNLDYNPTIDSSRVWINALSGGDDPQAVVGTGFEVTEMVSRLVSVEHDGTSAILVDPSGIVLAHRDVEIMEHNARARDDADKVTVFDLVSDDGDRRAVRELFSRMETEDVAVAQVRIGDTSGLAAAAPVYGLDALVLATVDTSEFLSLQDFTPLFLLVFSALVLVLAGTTFFVDRIVLRPLASLTSSATRIAGGAYDSNVSVTGAGEIGVLAASFQRMIEEIRRYTGNLEQMVAERTEELTTANRRMTESINYAQVLQEGIMPSRATVQRRLPGSSVFFRQRDSVGGDMIYLREVSDSTGNTGMVLAAVDCEGHGVSGALMTMAVHSILDHAVGACDPTEPHVILQEAETMLTATLSSRSGFDIGLCSWLIGSSTMAFAGAGMPLYVREPTGEITTIRGRARAIQSEHRTTPTHFATEPVPVPGRRFFLVTDGFVDQGGGDHGRSYGTGRLYSFVRNFGTAAHRDWEEEFDGYRGRTPQRDDVLAITWTFQEGITG